jgi:competence protein ComEC
VLHKEIPFLRIGLPLCAGIISGLYIKPEGVFPVLVIFISVSGFLVSLFFNKYPTNHIFGYSLTTALYICGLLLYSNEKNSISQLEPEPTLFYCTLSDYPEEKENSLKLTVTLNGIIKSARSDAVQGSMLLYSKKDSSVTSLLPGDNLIVKCTPVEITNRGNPYEFDYRFFMESHGIRYYAFTGNNGIICYKSPHRRKLVYSALIIREKIIKMYETRGITGERLALVAAMTLGQKNMLDQDQKQYFIKAGVMHIMAVSGLHAVVLSVFVFNILFFLKRRFNILRIIITILILWSFAFVTGLTPSVLRATLMFSFIQAGSHMKRPVNGINSVLASAFILILVRPSVIFDAGFLLSYSAVIFIISFYREFCLKLQFKSWLSDKIWQSVVITVVAQAGTLPLTIMLFNRFPTLFILTNVIIVPLSSLVIILGCLVPLTFPVHFLSKFLALLLDHLTGLTEMLTARASALPFSTLENLGMTTIECILLSATIYLFLHFLLGKKSLSVLVPICALILFSLAGTLRVISSTTTSEIIVYNTPGSSQIGIRTGKMLTLYSDTSLAGQEVIRHCATIGLKMKNSVFREKYNCIRAGEKRILISKSLDESIIRNFKPDIVILTGKRPVTGMKTSFSAFTFKLIISPEVSSGFRLQQPDDSSSMNNVHFVRNSGAYTERI